MLRTLQAIDWGLTPPYPLAIHPRVNVFTGPNGSGKSSAMDALKAVLGCGRFGQNRTPSSYLNNGRGTHPPARDAYVLLGCEISDRPDLPFCDETGRFTLVLWVNRTRRRHLALPGHVVLGVNGRPLAQDLEEFLDQHPRSDWLSPEDYARRVLDPLGATRGVRKLLEVPQGEAQRLLDVGRSQRLLHDLLELMGALEPLQELGRRRVQYREAQDARATARQAHTEEELRLTQAQLRLAADSRLPSAREALDGVEARLRGAAHSELAQIAAQVEDLQIRRAELAAARDRVGTDLAQAQEQAHALRSAPDAWQSAQRAVDALTDAGLDAQLLLSTLTPQEADAQQLSAAAEHLCAVVIASENWDALQPLLTRHPDVRFLRSANPGTAWEQVRPAADRLTQVGDSHVGIDDDQLVPRLSVQLPFAPGAPQRVRELEALGWEIRRDEDEIRRLERELADRRTRASELLERLGEEPVEAAAADELAGLQAERRRAQIRVSELEADEARRADRQRRLDAQRERVEEARSFLESQEGALEEARAALSSARRVYMEQVRRFVGELNGHFQSLCADANMAGALILREDAMAEAGGRLEVQVAETKGGALRSFGDADLSGGWKAKTSVLLLLAAICAAGGRHTLPVCLLDEHSAQMDEDRIREVGQVFQTLARGRSMQFVCAMPSKRSTEAAEWTDTQVGFLKAPDGERYAPLPHVIEASDEATQPRRTA